jgi:hypothetical protein
VNRCPRSDELACEGAALQYVYWCPLLAALSASAERFRLRLDLTLANVYQIRGMILQDIDRMG